MERTLQHRLSDRIYEDAYEEAMDAGEIHYLSATRIDPGCYSEEVDVEFGDFIHPTDDDGLVMHDTLEVTAKATVGSRFIFERKYEAYLYDNKLFLDYEEV